MAKINVKETIIKYESKINHHYDMSIDDIRTIINISESTTEMIMNAFVFGYAQATKAKKKK